MKDPVWCTELIKTPVAYWSLLKIWKLNFHWVNNWQRKRFIAFMIWLPTVISLQAERLMNQSNVIQLTALKWRFYRVRRQGVQPIRVYFQEWFQAREHHVESGGQRFSSATETEFRCGRFLLRARIAGPLRLRVERRYGIFQEIVEKHAIFGLV